MPSKLLQSLLSYIFTVSCLFLLGEPAYAQGLCQDIFKASGGIGSFKVDFKHDTKYSNELSEQTNIKNQCQLGTCHLHAWASSIEKAHLRRTGEEIQVSMPYLTAVHWINRAVQAATSKDPKNVKVKLGATVVDSRAVIRKFGVIPEGVWSPKTRFEQAPVSHRLEEFVVNRIAKAKWELSRELTEEGKQKIRDRAEVDLNNIFSEIAGQLPSHFEYKGKKYTPIEFAQEKFPEAFESRVNVMVNASRKEPTFRRKSGGDTLIDTDINTTERLVREAIDAGAPVYLGYEHNSNYVDRRSGIMAISAFHLPKNSGPLSREQRRFFNTGDGGHAVQLIGYDLDSATGKVIKWKIQNSWGEKSGDNGVYHMYNDYFRAFARSVSFSKDAQVVLPDNEVKSEGQYLLPF